MPQPRQRTITLALAAKAAAARAAALARVRQRALAAGLIEPKELDLSPGKLRGRLPFGFIGDAQEAAALDVEFVADVPPTTPTDAMPGTPEKMEVLSERFDAGTSLHHPRDTHLRDPMPECRPDESPRTCRAIGFRRWTAPPDDAPPADEWLDEDDDEDEGGFYPE